MNNKYLLSITTATILALSIATPIGSSTVGDQAILRLTDLTGDTYTFKYSQFLDMPKTEVTADLYCDGALVTYGDWGGVSLNYLLNQTKLNTGVQSIQFIASDGYQVAIPFDLAIKPQIIIAYELNGQPLAEGLRLVVPDANGASWIAKITAITMSIYGAPYPQAISVGHIKGQNVVPTQPESPSKPSPTQRESPIQLNPFPIENSSSSLTETTPIPTNVTQPNTSATNPPVSTQSPSLQYMLYLVVACALFFTTVAFTVFLHRRNRVSGSVGSISK